MPSPVFDLPGLSEEPFTPPGWEAVSAVPATEFELEDVRVGRSVMSGITTSGNIKTGVVSRIIRGCGFAFDCPYQNGIFWSQMWLHDDDCGCHFCATVSAGEPIVTPPNRLRRTDSGCDYGMFGSPDCAFWERAGVEPLFVATEKHYGLYGDPTVEDRDERVRVELLRREPTEAEGAYRRAWERQMGWFPAVAAPAPASLRTATLRPVTPPVSPGRAPFMEPPPLRGSRPATPPVVAEVAPVTPDRPTRPVEPLAAKPQRRLEEAAPARVGTSDLVNWSEGILEEAAAERIERAFGRLKRLAEMLAQDSRPDGTSEMVADAAEPLDALLPPPWSDRPLERQVAGGEAASDSDGEEAEEHVVDATEMVRRLRIADVLAAPLPMNVGQGCAVFVAIVAILWMYAVCLAHR